MTSPNCNCPCIPVVPCCESVACGPDSDCEESDFISDPDQPSCPDDSTDSECENDCPEIPGPPGPQGSQGINGFQGNIGPAGQAGAQGGSGPQGQPGGGSQGIPGLTGVTGAQGRSGSQGIPGLIGAIGAQGGSGSQGILGVQGGSGPQGTGNTGAQGNIGIGVQGIIGVQGAFRYAEYVQLIQGDNASRAPGDAISYTGAQGAFYDTIGIITASGPGGTGTAFQLPIGVYMVDWENSNSASWSLAIYQGATATIPLIGILPETIAGATTAGSWIHGRAIITATIAKPFIMISPRTGTASIGDPTTGSAEETIARITFLQLM